MLKAGTAVDFYVRTDPASVVEPDDGSYEYRFNLIGQPDGDGGNTAGVGGLTIVNDQTDENKAHITGAVPADQVGKTFSVNCTVLDTFGAQIDGTALSKVWTA